MQETSDVRLRKSETPRPPEKRAAVVLSQTFRADDASEQSAIRQVLFDGAQGILAGEKRRAHPARHVVAANKGRLLDVDFEHNVALIKFRRAREIAQP